MPQCSSQGCWCCWGCTASHFPVEPVIFFFFSILQTHKGFLFHGNVLWTSYLKMKNDCLWDNSLKKKPGKTQISRAVGVWVESCFLPLPSSHSFLTRQKTQSVPELAILNNFLSAHSDWCSHPVCYQLRVLWRGTLLFLLSLFQWVCRLALCCCLCHMSFDSLLWIWGNSLFLYCFYEIAKSLWDLEWHLEKWGRLLNRGIIYIESGFG